MSIVDDLTLNQICQQVQPPETEGQTTYVAFLVRTPSGILHRLSGKSEMTQDRPGVIYTRFRPGETVFQAAKRAMGPGELIEKFTVAGVGVVSWVLQPAERLLVLTGELSAVQEVDYVSLTEPPNDGYPITREFWRIALASKEESTERG